MSSLFASFDPHGSASVFSLGKTAPGISGRYSGTCGSGHPPRSPSGPAASPPDGASRRSSSAVLQYVAKEFGGEDPKKAWAKHFIEHGMAAVERILAKSAGTCCVGDTVTLADAYVPAPPTHSSPH